MKGIIKYFFAFFIIMFLSACNNELLEETPRSQVDSKTFFESDEGLDFGTTGLYQSFKDGFISTGTGFFIYLTAWDDITNANASRFGEVLAGNFKPDDTMMRDQWIRFYTTIGACNNFIENATEYSTASDEVKYKYIGEAKFIRALCYYYMVNIWGPVPLITNKPEYRSGALEDPDYFNARPEGGIKDVYDLIISDLRFAAQYCWDRAESRSFEGATIVNNLGRVTRSSAKGLLAKVYLRLATGAKVAVRYDSENPGDPAITNTATGQPDGVSAYSIYDDKVDSYLDSCIFFTEEVASHGHSLQNEFMDNFKYGSKDGIESLFEVQAMQELNYGSRVAAYYNPSYSDYYGGTWGGESVAWQWWFRNYGTFQYVKVSQPDSVQNLEIRFFDPDGIDAGLTAYTGAVNNIPNGSVKVYNLCLDFSDYRQGHNDCTYQTMDITRHPNSANNREYYFNIDQAKYAYLTQNSAGVYTARNAPGYNGLYWKKYQSSGSDSHDTNGANYIILRYADVLLCKAEALFEKGGEANWRAAYEILVQVRTRNGSQNMLGTKNITSVYDPKFSFPVGDTDSDGVIHGYDDFKNRWIKLFAADTQIASPSDEQCFREVILYERYAELYSEGHRWLDLMRMGKLGHKLGKLNRPRMRKHYYFPIPSVEMDSNPKIDRGDNNPGWEDL